MEGINETKNWFFDKVNKKRQIIKERGLQMIGKNRQYE